MQSVKQAVGSLISALASDLLLEIPLALRCDVAELTFDQVNDVARVRFDGLTPSGQTCSGVVEISLADDRTLRALAKTDVDGGDSWHNVFMCGYTQSIAEFLRMIRVAVAVSLSNA